MFIFIIYLRNVLYSPEPNPTSSIIVVGSFYVIVTRTGGYIVVAAAIYSNNHVHAFLQAEKRHVELTKTIT